MPVVQRLPAPPSNDPNATTAIEFSDRLREASWGAHQGAESSPAMKGLFDGSLPVKRYALLVLQYRAIYTELEAATAGLANDPALKVFVFPELTRLAALDADLAALIGEDDGPELSVLPATEAYLARLRAVRAEWPAGVVAHQYVRSMGDLSGGQMIGRVVRRVFDLDADSGAGTAFYRFDDIEDAAAWKDAYRALLNGAPWDPEEQDRFIAEVLEAYRLNTALLAELPAD